MLENRDGMSGCVGRAYVPAASDLCDAAGRYARPTVLPLRGRGGFTLVECLIAGVVLAGFAAAIATTLARSTAAALRSEDQRLAAQWLDEVLTRVDLLGPARIATEGPRQGELDERFSFALDLVQDDLNADLYIVTATITCPTASGGTQTVTGHTQLFDPAGSRTSLVYWEDLDDR